MVPGSRTPERPSGETDGNPIEGYQGGELAGALAESMAGLADMFDLVMEDAETVAQRDVVSSALAFCKEEHRQVIIDAQEHGLQLADNIQYGAGEIAETDWESSDDFKTPGAWAWICKSMTDYQSPDAAYFVPIIPSR